MNEREVLALAAEDLAAYAVSAYPQFEIARHIQLLMERLEAVERGEIRRLMIFLPPRHGKSVMATQLFPAWYLGRHPDRSIITASYGQELADDFGRRVRNLVAEPLHRAMFPNCWLSDDSSAVHRFSTTRGGNYYAAGRGGPITGRGADLLVIDDPLKDMEEASSETIRRSLHEWYASVVYTRLQPGAAIVLIQTRWHLADLAGWLLEAKGDPYADRWEVLLLPAENPEGGATIPPDLPPYEALWPRRYPVEELRRIKASIGSHAYEALYMQRPTPQEGSIIKRKWFRFYRELPQLDEQIQSWDMSFRESADSSYVVGQVWGRRGADKFLIDQVRARMDFPKTLAAVRSFTAKHPRAHAKYVEDKANGPAVVATLKQEIPGLIEVAPEGSKEARLSAASADFEAGNVYVPDPSMAPWVLDYIEELATFPNGPHDDQCDSTSQALLRFRLSADALWMLIQREKQEAAKAAEAPKPPQETHRIGHLQLSDFRRPLSDFRR